MFCLQNLLLNSLLTLFTFLRNNLQSRLIHETPPPPLLGFFAGIIFGFLNVFCWVQSCATFSYKCQAFQPMYVKISFFADFDFSKAFRKSAYSLLTFFFSIQNGATFSYKRHAFQQIYVKICFD